VNEMGLRQIESRPSKDLNMKYLQQSLSLAGFVRPDGIKMSKEVSEYYTKELI